VDLRGSSSTKIIYYICVQCEYTSARVKGVFGVTPQGRVVYSCLDHQRILISRLTRGSGSGGSMSLGRRGCIVDNAPSPPCTTSSRERALLPSPTFSRLFTVLPPPEIYVFGCGYFFCFVILYTNRVSRTSSQ